MRGDANMEYRKEDVFVFQLVHYFVSKYNYEIVRVQQQKDDIWLINARHEKYPILRLSPKSIDANLHNMEYVRAVHRALCDLMQRECKVVMFDTDKNSISMQNDLVDVVRITPDEISDHELVDEFQNIDKVLHEVEDTQQEFVRLSKSLEEVSMKRQRMQRMRLSQMPRITLILSIICVLMYCFTSIMAAKGDSVIGGAIMAGAYYKMNVVGAYEYWRLLTCHFVHYDIFHLILNIYALCVVSSACERMYTKKQYLTILFVSGIMSSIFILIGEANLVALGISAMLFGIFGAYVIYLWESTTLKHPLIKANVVKMGLVVIIVSISPGISWIGHLGGFIGGCFAAILILKNPNFEGLRKNTYLALAAMLGVLAYMFVNNIQIEPLQKKADSDILKAYDKAGWNAYGNYLEEQYQKVYKEE